MVASGHQAAVGDVHQLVYSRYRIPVGVDGLSRVAREHQFDLHPILPSAILAIDSTSSWVAGRGSALTHGSPTL